MKNYPDGLKQAILAVSFFKSRHDRRKAYKRSRRHANDTIPGSYPEHARIARNFIAEARKHGFRGSVVEAVCGGNL